MLMISNLLPTLLNPSLTIFILPYIMYGLLLLTAGILYDFPRDVAIVSGM